MTVSNPSLDGVEGMDSSRDQPCGMGSQASLDAGRNLGWLHRERVEAWRRWRFRTRTFYSVGEILRYRRDVLRLR